MVESLLADGRRRSTLAPLAPLSDLPKLIGGDDSGASIAFATLAPCQPEAQGLNPDVTVNLENDDSSSSDGPFLVSNSGCDGSAVLSGCSDDRGGDSVEMAV